MNAVFSVFALAVLGCVSADTPANCTYEDTRGGWTFSIGERGHDRTLNCSTFKAGRNDETLQVKLFFPDLAVDQYGNEGFWTLIYNQGFEIVIAGRKYFMFSKYSGSGPNATSICDQTMPGWSHDIFDRDWACVTGTKNQRVPAKKYTDTLKKGFENAMYKNDYDLIDEINKKQSSWRAAAYPEHEMYTIEEMIRRAGGRGSRILSRPKPTPVTEEVARRASELPDALDWRHYKGHNFVSPIRNQESCGSCYAFASMAMHEARVRIMTNNTKTPVFSPQDVVECSEYSQGCEGGFPYLIAGKYAEDFGIVEEDCNPYKGKDNKCTTKKTCARQYATGYKYLGGFYGGCNEEVMKIALVENGPVAVGFEVYKDFFNYKGGIYHHTGLKGTFNPFEITNHAVLVVGYGADPTTGERFWIVKNSWGPTWGEEGYFRIRRGTDEVAIESMALEAFPLF